MERAVDDLDREYREWRRGSVADAGRSAARLDYRPLVSVVMPVYETPAGLLRDAVRSLRSQTYGRWQLCIADDGSRSRQLRLELVRLRIRHPFRVRAVRLRENRGIATACNAALAQARGDFVAFLDHDDLLEPDGLEQVVKRLNERPEADFLYSDEDKLSPGGVRTEPAFKPDWSPDTLLSMNYVNHLSVVRRDLLERLGGLRTGFDGSQDYDLVLRVAETTDRIEHVPCVLYRWRVRHGSAAGETFAKPYAFEAAKRALREAVERRGIDATVEDGRFAGSYRVRYALRGRPAVAVAGPGADRLCAATGYEGAFATPDPLAGEAAEHVLLLAAACAPAAPGWLEALLEHAQREEIGAVGARLVSPEGRIVHDGVTVGLGSDCRMAPAGHGYLGLGEVVRNVSAVAGCVLTRASLLRELGGLDGRMHPVLAQVDYCLRLRERGYRIVYTPFAELVTSADLQPASDDDTTAPFYERWRGTRDPYYNPNLSRTRLYRLDV
ncbi:MAG TPA: glycosyltransferase [Gaiellaceae bacterium]|nr:glycosyltransferase [Gaiellaceae bacterium]